LEENVTMIYSKFVEIGRVVFIAKGKDEGKLAVIVNVIDGNRVLLDGPSSDVPRYVRNFKDLQLTKFKIPIRVGQRTKNIKAVYDSAKINDEWNKTEWAKKLTMKRLRTSLNDFERFKVFRAKQLRNRLVKTELGKLRRAARSS